jgi:hypothetical protein
MSKEDYQSMSEKPAFAAPSAPTGAYPEAIAIQINVDSGDQVATAFPTDQMPMEADVVETFSLYTAEDYANPLRFLFKTLMYIVLSPFVFMFYLLPMMVKWLCKKIVLCSEASCELLGKCCWATAAFLHTYLFMPIYNYILVPIWTVLVAIYKALDYAVTQVCNAIGYVCMALWSGTKYVATAVWKGMCVVGNFLWVYFLEPIVRGVSYVCNLLCTGIAWVCEGLLFCLTKFCEGVCFVLRSIGTFIAYVGGLLREYVFMPLYNFTVLVCGMLSDGVCCLGRASRDYFFYPMWNGLVCFFSSIRDYVVLPLYNGVVFVVAGFRDNVVYPVWNGMYNYLLLPSYNAACFVAAGIYNAVAWVAAGIYNAVAWTAAGIYNGVVVPIATGVGYVLSAIAAGIEAVGSAVYNGMVKPLLAGVRGVGKALGSLFG